MLKDAYEGVTLIGNADGRLHAQRQVEDYMYRGTEFEDMGFLTFTVESYERRIQVPITEVENALEENNTQSGRRTGCYMTEHPKAGSHYRVRRSDGHNFLPNIVGPWLPRRDENENDNCYYHAAMLTFLKPWRNLSYLKANDETWETAFNTYIEATSQRDRDVVAGCQYYYDSRTVVGKEGNDEDTDLNNERNDEQNFRNDMEDDDDLEEESSKTLVSHE